MDDLEGAKRAGDRFDYPLMIKSKRLAYDGRGNAVAKSEEDLTSAVTGNILFDDRFLVFCCHDFNLLCLLLLNSRSRTFALLLLSKFVAALGGFDRGLYVEKWAPFIKVSV